MKRRGNTLFFLAARAQSARVEFSIISRPANFVKCFFEKFCIKMDPEICAIFYVKTFDNRPRI
jgi:hypothetical protein